MSYLVKIDYFKPSGKFYGSGGYETEKELIHQIFEELGGMLREGVRPGMVDGHDGFTAVVRVPQHPFDHPHAYIGEA